MDKEISKRLLRKGLSLLKNGHAVEAVFCFEELLVASNRSAQALSCLGLAMARAGLDLKAAKQLCIEAIKKEPYWADFYRSLAEVYLRLGKKTEAISILRKGLKIDKTDRGIIRELKRLGIRKSPPIPFLRRSNFLNKYLGLMRSGPSPKKVKSCAGITNQISR